MRSLRVAFGALGIETQLAGNWRGRFEYVTSLLRSNVYRDGFKVEVSPQINTVIVAGAEVVGTLSTSKSRYLLQATPLAPVVSEATGLVGRNREWYSARLRSGYLVSPETMAYGFLGYTRVHSALDAVGMLSLVGQTYNQTYNRQGLEFGGGVESWVTKSMTLRVEYGFAQLGKVDLVKNAPMLGTLKHRQSNGMVAVAYHF